MSDATDLALNAVTGGDTGAVGSASSSGMDGNSLVAALAGDATKVFGAYELADTAKHTVKANPQSANTLILVAGGVAALFVILLLIRR